MTPNDPNITWLEEPKLGWAGRMYLPLFLDGLEDHRHARRQSEGDDAVPG